MPYDLCTVVERNWFAFCWEGVECANYASSFKDSRGSFEASNWQGWQTGCCTASTVIRRTG